VKRPVWGDPGLLLFSFSFSFSFSISNSPYQNISLRPFAQNIPTFFPYSYYISFLISSIFIFHPSALHVPYSHPHPPPPPPPKNQKKPHPHPHPPAPSLPSLPPFPAPSHILLQISSIKPMYYPLQILWNSIYDPLIRSDTMIICRAVRVTMIPVVHRTPSNRPQIRPENLARAPGSEEFSHGVGLSCTHSSC